MRRPGRNIRKIAAQHAPTLAVQFHLDVACHHNKRRMAGEMSVPWHRRARYAGECGELIRIACFKGPCDARHHQRTEAMIFAFGVR